MANQVMRLYVDVDRSVLVESLTSRTTIRPTFVQGDTVSLEVYLLERNPTGGIAAPYSKVSVNGMSLRVGIGTPSAATGTSAPGIFQNTFTADTVNNKLTGSLYITPATVASALGSALSADSILEIEKSEGGLYNTVFQGPCTLRAELIEAATAPVATPTDTYMTSAESRASFVGWNNTDANSYGKPIVLTSPSGTHTVTLWVDDNGVFHADTT